MRLKVQIVDGYVTLGGRIFGPGELVRVDRDLYESSLDRHGHSMFLASAEEQVRRFGREMFRVVPLTPSELAAARLAEEWEHEDALAAATRKVVTHSRTVFEDPKAR